MPRFGYSNGQWYDVSTGQQVKDPARVARLNSKRPAGGAGMSDEFTKGLFNTLSSGFASDDFKKMADR